MRPFAYARSTAPDQAVAAVAANREAAYVAGGTTLVDLMRLDVLAPGSLVDIGDLPLGKIEPLANGGLRIGALVKNSDLANDAAVKARYPVLSEALLAGASPQIRNMASVGGNLLQRARCPYFRDAAYTACNKRAPGTGCSAQGGYTRSHAVLGASPACAATSPGDMPVALTALDAVVTTRRPAGGERSIPIAEFFLSSGESPARETVLEPGELITAVELPATTWFARSRYAKVRDRASYDFALASAAVALDVANGAIREARVALGGVAGKPWRSKEAEAVLAGKKAGPDAFRAAAEAALRGARPLPHNGFKVELAKRTLVRALESAAAPSGRNA